MMAWRVLGHAPALLVSLLLALPLAAQPTAHAGRDGVAGVETMTPAAIAARGAAAQTACAERPRPLCLAEIALARAAAGQGPQSLGTTEVAASVVTALAEGGHGATLRTLLPLIAAVERMEDPSGQNQSMSPLAFARAGLPEEARRVLAGMADAQEKAYGALRIAVETLDRDDLAAAEAAADELDLDDRGAGRAWARLLTLAAAGDRRGVEAMLDALARSPDFEESWNGDPTGPETFTLSMPRRFSGDVSGALILGDTNGTLFVGNAGGITVSGSQDEAYSGLRNLHRLAAFGFAVLGDAERALTAAEAIRYPVGRLFTYQAIARRLPAAQASVDARIIALAATMPRDPTLRMASLSAHLRLGQVEEVAGALQRLAEQGVAAWMPDVSAPWRQLAAAYQRLGPLHAQRVHRVADSAASASRRFLERHGLRNLTLQESINQSAAQVRLSAALAARDRPQDVADLLRRYARGHEIERCVAQRDGDCLALILILQAIEESPSD